MMSVDRSYRNRHKNINLRDNSMILFLDSKRRIYVEVNIIFNRNKIDLLGSGKSKIYTLLVHFVASIVFCFWNDQYPRSLRPQRSCQSCSVKHLKVNS